MQAADLIKKILERKKLSVTALAKRLGVDGSYLTRCSTGEREPGPLPSLLLAGLTELPEERAFWIAKSGFDASQLHLIAAAIGAPAPTVQPGEEAQLLEWWRHPENPMEESIKNVVEKLLASRTK